MRTFYRAESRDASTVRQLLIRSSPRKRGPRANNAAPENRALDSRLRGNERNEGQRRHSFARPPSLPSTGSLCGMGTFGIVVSALSRSAGVSPRQRLYVPSGG